MRDRGNTLLEDAREALELEEAYRAATEQDWVWRLRKAVLVSPSIDVCEALLRGEQVPACMLDPVALRRYGRRA